MPKMEISGNTQSLKASILDELSALYDILPDSHSFLPEQLLGSIAAISGSINREIAVYLNRKGTVLDICIGDSSTVTLSQVEGRRSRTRLSGVRCIHTHPNGDSMLSAVDIHTLLVLNLDAMASIGVLDGRITGISAALPITDRTSDNPEMPDKAPGQPDTETDNFWSNAEIFGPFGHCSEMDFLLELIRERDREFSRNGELRTEQEKAVLVGLELGRGRQQAGMGEAERSLAELGELARTAGLLVCQTVLQRRPTQDPAFYIGRGKVEELSLIIQSLGADHRSVDI
jgi:GTP-binding protein HflX